MTDSLRGLPGIAVILALAWLLGDRRRPAWRPVVGGVALQWALALLLLRAAPARQVLLLANDAADALQRATDAGTGFVFGYLGGGTLPFTEAHPGAAFILAFKALPLVLVISALSAVLFHWGVLQAVAGAFAFVLRRTLGLGGALALGAAVHVFVGMIEAPLIVRPWLARMDRGELFALMSCGMAGIAGTVMVIYATILSPVLPDALSQILAASVISTPAAVAIAALMIPFGTGPAGPAVRIERHSQSTVDAAIRGTLDGVPVLVGIAAVLLVTVALVALANAALALLPDVAGGPVTLQRGAALAFRPLAWLIGVPWAESHAAAGLLATKTVLNEFVAYLDLAHLPPAALSPRSRLILTYALCGFANFGSMGILVGGLNAMLPDRRREIAALGLRSILSGTLATCSSGAVAGLLAG